MPARIIGKSEHFIGDPVVAATAMNVSRLVITGWEATLHTWSTDGFVWIRREDDGADSSLEIFRQMTQAETFADGDRLCGASTLAESAAIENQA